MHTKTAIKKFASLLASVGLLSGLALTSGASPVSAAIQYPDVRINLERDYSAASVDVENGQTVEIVISASINQTWSGWDSNPTTFSMSAFDIGVLPTGVTLTKTEYYWDATNTVNPSANCYQNQMYTTDPTKVNFTLTVSCKNDITRVYSEIIYTITNNSGSPQTIDTNAESAEMTSGGSPVAEGEANVFAYSILELTSSGIEVPDNTGNGIELEFGTLCVAADVANGTEVTIVRDVTLDNTETIGFWNITDAMPSVYLSDYTYAFRDGDDADNLPEDTFVVDAMNRTFFVNMRLSIQNDTIEGKNLKVSLDLTLGGVSKLSSSCGGGGGMDTFPTLGSLSGGAAAGKGKLSAAISLPADAVNGGGFQGTTAGYSGDVFYWGTTEAKATVAHLGPTGALKVNGVNLLSKTIESTERLYSFAWYGAKRDKYVMVVGPIEMTTTSSYKLYFGNLNKTGTTPMRTLPANKVHGSSGICGTAGYEGTVFAIAAPTASPVLSVNCRLEGEEMNYQAISYNVFGALTNDGASGAKITAFGTPIATESKPCLYVSLGVNRNAKGKSAAVLIYSALGTKTTVDGPPDPVCAGAGGSNRSLISVSGAMKVKKKTFTSGPFGATESRMSISAGKSANSWLVVASAGGFAAPPTVGKAFTVGATLVPKATKTAPKLLAGDGFVAPSMMAEDGFVPITTLKNGQWLVIRTQRTYGGSSSYKITIAKYNPTSGAITNGEVLSITGGSGSGNPKYINGFGWTTKNDLSYFALTEAGKYKVATWKAFTK